MKKILKFILFKPDLEQTPRKGYPPLPIFNRIVGRFPEMINDRGTSMEVALPADDPKLHEILHFLEHEQGLRPMYARSSSHKTPDSDNLSFRVENRYEFNEKDLDKAPFLYSYPKVSVGDPSLGGSDNWNQWGIGKVHKRVPLIGLLGYADVQICSAAVRAEMEQEGFIGLDFLPILVHDPHYKQDDFWRVWASRTMPCTAMPLSDDKGNPVQEDYSTGCYIDEQVEEFVLGYRSSDLEAMSGTDFALTAEKWGPLASRFRREHLLVSQRFRQWCLKKKIKVDWIPVISLPDETENLPENSRSYQLRSIGPCFPAGTSCGKTAATPPPLPRSKASVPPPLPGALASTPPPLPRIQAPTEPLQHNLETTPSSRPAPDAPLHEIVSYALRVLGLSAPISRELLQQAYAAAREAWKPERLAGNAGLIAQAQDRINEIEAAHDILFLHEDFQFPFMLADGSTHARPLVPQKMQGLLAEAEAGSAEAQYRLGRVCETGMYDDTTFITRNEVEAARWYRLAAVQGHAPAQAQLGNSCILSSGYAAAIPWFLKAAAQGDAEAQYQLGLLCKDGRGMPEGAAAAVQWFQKSAAQGHARACYELGCSYHSGEGVPEDLGEALKWLLISAAIDDDEDANQMAACIEDQLSEPEIEEAQSLAEDFQSNNRRGCT